MRIFVDSWFIGLSAGDTAYSVQNRIGEGAYAKIYRIVPKAAESQRQASSVIKVCDHTLLASLAPSFDYIPLPPLNQNHLYIVRLDRKKMALEMWI